MQAAPPGFCGPSETKMQPLDSRVYLRHYLVRPFGGAVAAALVRA